MSCVSFFFCVDQRLCSLSMGLWVMKIFARLICVYSIRSNYIKYRSSIRIGVTIVWKIREEHHKKCSRLSRRLHTGLSCFLLMCTMYTTICHTYTVDVLWEFGSCMTFYLMGVYVSTFKITYCVCYFEQGLVFLHSIILRNDLKFISV